MKKKVILLTILSVLLLNTTANATTVMGVIGKRKIILVSDTRLTITKADGEVTFNDNGTKLFKLSNGVGVAFVGDTNSSKRIHGGKSIIVKSVTTIINDISKMKELETFNLAETTELIAEKYVNLLPDYSGDILVAGYEKDEPRIYGIRVVNGRAVWKGVAGRGSFWAIGSGCNILMSKLKDKLECEQDISCKELSLDYLSKLDDRKMEKIMKSSLEKVIEEYEENYNYNERTTGGEVDTLVISK